MNGETRLVRAGRADLDDVLTLVAAYHAFEGIASSHEERRSAVDALLGDPSLGEVWLVEQAGRRLGYVAVCFRYSIEFAGRDAFVDELFIVEEARGQGLGRQVLEQVARRLSDAGIAALHLEVARDNTAAKTFYAGLGFEDRSKYHLMSLDLAGDDQPG